MSGCVCDMSWDFSVYAKIRVRLFAMIAIVVRLKACERVCVHLMRNWDIRESFSFSNVSFDEHFIESRKSLEVS